MTAHIGPIDDNQGILVAISEENGNILKAFTVKASRKGLRRLKKVAAYNVAQHLSLDNDMDFLQEPNSLKKLV